LGAHLETLAQAGYVSTDKRFVGKKPQTRVRATGAGRQAFAAHVAYLRALLEEPVGADSESVTETRENWSGGHG
jgi:hypothetical protein